MANIFSAPLSRLTHPRLKLAIAALAIVVLGTPQPAWAHHAMGSKLPSNGLEGFLAGLAHPVIGLDHLAFIVAIGLIAAGRLKGWLLPTGFVAGALVGTIIHVGRFNLPLGEIFVATSVIGLGTLLALNVRLNFAGLLALAIGAGIFHGYAYGESIVGAEGTPLWAYLVGFSLIQLAIALLFRYFGQLWQQQAGFQWQRYCGYGVMAIGLAFLAQTIVS
jgi:urease accessory protein